jgi:LacI family transcriptional regulator
VEWAIDSVISDGFTAEINVVNHLVSLGHRNIVMLAYEMEDYNIDLRTQGFLSGLSSANLSGGSSAVIRGWLSHDDIYAALLNRLKSPNPPTAVVTVNDTLAMAMIKRLKDDGVGVPDQLSVVGYDDDVVITEGRPFLSTVRVDKRELGRIGAELILKRIASRDSPVVKLRLPTEFILRESVAAPAAQSR